MNNISEDKYEYNYCHYERHDGPDKKTPLSQLPA